MALRGLRPVVEIMFGDFVTLIADQLINHIAKFSWMYNDQVRVPLVVRTPMGGRRGYGPTHSQTLEKLYLGIPGLRMLAPGAVYSQTDPPYPQGEAKGGGLTGPGGLLLRAILEDDDPVLFIENKLLYALPLVNQKDLPDFDIETSAGIPPGYAPTYSLRIRGAPAPELTLTAYGYMAELVREAALNLAYEEEIFTELVVPTQLAPFKLEPVLASARRTGRLLVAEEGGLTLGWGAEVMAAVVEAMAGQPLRAGRVAARDLPIPASAPLEASVLPTLEDITRAAREMLGKRGMERG
jgi:pyruvate/2-oxoglutarate/acetoin dehydrogenase E1 component